MSVGLGHTLGGMGLLISAGVSKWPRTLVWGPATYRWRRNSLAFEIAAGEQYALGRTLRVHLKEIVTE